MIGIYTGLYVYKENWFDFEKFICPLWIARYPSSVAITFGMLPGKKKLPNVGRPIWEWQFSSNGVIPGISTSVDFMDHFRLVSEYKPTGDQPQAIAVLNKPTLIIAHNKTLAG